MAGPLDRAQITYPAVLPRPPAPAPVAAAAPPPVTTPVGVSSIDPLLRAQLEGNALLRELVTQSNDIREYLRLIYLGQQGSPTSTREPDKTGDSLATSPAYTELYRNSGRAYSVAVRVQAIWNTPGGFVNVAYVTGSDGNVTAYIKNGETDATTDQFLLAPNEAIYIGVAPASAGGVPLSAQDKFRVLVSDDSRYMAGPARRFQVKGN